MDSPSDSSLMRPDFAGVRAECAHPGVRAECPHPARAANGPILACLTDTAACSTDKNDF